VVFSGVFTISLRGPEDLIKIVNANRPRILLLIDKMIIGKPQLYLYKQRKSKGGRYIFLIFGKM